MLLYCRNGIVIATHGDDQNVPASAYGQGVSIIPSGTELAIGAPAPAATPDTLKAYAANKRYQVETGGVVVGFVPVATDRQSQSMLTGAFVKAQGDNTFTTEWKGADGQFVALNAAALIALGNAVAAHVAECFATEKSVVDGIDAETITTFAGVDAAFT